MYFSSYQDEQALWQYASRLKFVIRVQHNNIDFYSSDTLIKALSFAR